MAQSTVAAILCTGSAGDLVPFLALGIKIREKSGGQVAIITSPNHRGMVESRDLLWANIGIDPVEELFLKKGTNTSFSTAIEEWIDNSLKACRELQPKGLVFTTMTLLACSSVAEALSLPYVVAHLGPMMPTSEHGPPVFGTGEVWFGYSATLQWRFFEYLAFKMHKPAVDKARAQLNLGKQKQTASLESRSSRAPQLMGYSAALCPRPSDVQQDYVHITGQWVDVEQDAEKQSVLTGPVAAFMHEAERDSKDVIFVTFGSLLRLFGSDAQKFGKLVQTLTSAILTAGARPLFSTKGCEELSIPSSVLKLQEDGEIMLVPGYLPHASIMSRCFAVICHGGSGTVHTALRASAPVIVIPGKVHMIDQHFWAARVSRCGVGAGPVYKSMMHARSAKPLVQVLKQMLANRDQVRAAAREMANNMRAEGGAAQAAEVTFNHFSK